MMTAGTAKLYFLLLTLHLASVLKSPPLVLQKSLSTTGLTVEGRTLSTINR